MLPRLQNILIHKKIKQKHLNFFRPKKRYILIFFCDDKKKYNIFSQSLKKKKEINKFLKKQN